MNWLRLIRGALGMGLAWAIAWGSAGLLFEVIWELLPGFPLRSLVGYLAEAVTIPGFLAGVIFFLVLRIAEDDHGFDELSYPRSAAWGALSGLVLGVLVIATLFPNQWLPAALMINPSIVLSAVSAAGLQLLAKMAKHFRRGTLETATK